MTPYARKALRDHYSGANNANAKHLEAEITTDAATTTTTDTDTSEAESEASYTLPSSSSPKALSPLVSITNDVRGVDGLSGQAVATALQVIFDFTLLPVSWW
jgi:hypothetical protein